MTFAELYGEALHHELGSSDVSELFTTARRKVAINRAQREFARLTQCFSADLVQPVTDGLAVYDLDVLSNNLFVNFKAQPVRLRRTTTASGAVSEDRLTRHDEPWLDAQNIGWRNSPQSGVADTYAFIVDGGTNQIALSLRPQVPTTETWELVVPVVLNPPDMANDGDVPFTWPSGSPLTPNPNMALEPYHWALAHFAASQLERLRKDTQAVEGQLSMFGAYIQDYKATRRPRGGDVRARQARDYYRRTRNSGSGAIEQGDPRV